MASTSQKHTNSKVFTRQKNDEEWIDEITKRRDWSTRRAAVARLTSEKTGFKIGVALRFFILTGNPGNLQQFPQTGNFQLKVEQSIVF